jgi:hypothetical protein
MSWLYHRNYIGPERRGGRFAVRFLERRKNRDDNGSQGSIQDSVRTVFARGLKWIDVSAYFGPDRRSGVFSHFILERRRQDSATTPPPLHAALRQLRVRVLEASNCEGRAAYRDRLIATAILAEAQGRTAIGDSLLGLAEALTDATDDADLSGALQTQLIAIEAMLGESNA